MFGKDDERYESLIADARQASSLRKITEQKLTRLENSFWELEGKTEKANQRVIAQRDRIDALFDYLGIEEQEVEAHTKIVKVKK